MWYWIYLWHKTPILMCLHCYVDCTWPLLKQRIHMCLGNIWINESDSFHSRQIFYCFCVTFLSGDTKLHRLHIILTCVTRSMKWTPCLFSARMWSERSFGSETRFTAKKLEPKRGHFDKISREEYNHVTDSGLYAGNNQYARYM